MEYNLNYVFSEFTLNLLAVCECNCNCVYCENIGDRIPYMTKAEYNYIFEECVKAHNNGLVKTYQIDLFGGEPLLKFTEFSNIISHYKMKYPELFQINIITNGTIMNNDILRWFRNNVNSVFCGVDTLKYSKPINGVNSALIQINNPKKLKDYGINITSGSVFNSQPLNDILEMTEYAVSNFDFWRISIERPLKLTKNEILAFSKPILKYLYEHNFYAFDKFTFESWDLWNKRYLKNDSKLICLQIAPGAIVDMGDYGNEKLNMYSSDILHFINHPINKSSKDNHYLDFCMNCELKNQCDGDWLINHKTSEMLREKCDAIKELLEYVQTLRK
jgi:sulfatase maturation enzyme AslB (radical SAM superfamily)